MPEQFTFIPQELIHTSEKFYNYHIPLQFKNVPQQLTVKDYTDCCLMIDGTARRKQMIYDKMNCKYEGFIDYANLSVENGEEYASGALVFILKGLKTYWKCPVGYFLTNKCNAKIQTSLLKNCLSLAADHGLRVWSVTCDRTSTNVTMLKSLGCKSKIHLKLW